MSQIHESNTDDIDLINFGHANDGSDNNFMEVTNSKSNHAKRVRSDSENSGSSTEHVRINSKRHFPLDNVESENVVVFAESIDVNLGKISPVVVARILNDLVSSVDNVTNSKNCLIIFCNSRQANLLKNEKKFGHYQCNFTLGNKYKNFKQKIQGIAAHGICLNMSVTEIKDEFESTLVKIDKVSRLKIYDQEKKEKVETTSIVIDFDQDTITHMYLGYKTITIKEFITHPVRCFNCQRFGHTAINCRGNKKWNKFNENFES